MSDVDQLGAYRKAAIEAEGAARAFAIDALITFACKRDRERIACVFDALETPDVTSIGSRIVLTARKAARIVRGGGVDQQEGTT